MVLVTAHLCRTVLYRNLHSSVCGGRDLLNLKVIRNVLGRSHHHKPHPILSFAVNNC